MHDDIPPARTPANRVLLAMLIAAMLAVPLFAVYLLVYDRQSQSRTARESIAQGWGASQLIAGPVLAIPYATQTQTTVREDGKPVTTTATVWHTLTLAPDVTAIDSTLAPQVRRRSIYETVVYEARTRGTARFSLPADFERYGVPRAALALERAELRFGVRDAGGLVGAPPMVAVDGRPLALQPGKGPPATAGSGFFTAFDASALGTRPVRVAYRYQLRGNGGLALAPQGGDTAWTARASWPSPSFQGDLLPGWSAVSAKGFAATWRVGNLALGRALVAIDADQATDGAPVPQARVELVTPVDVYDQVNRSVKYGFLFIGFTFMAFLMFDLIGGARVAPIELGLVGAGLVLFFVMLLAFAEVTGFAVAYAIAATAIIGLLTAYSAAVLASRWRAGFIAVLLAGLYGALYVLLSLEAYALLIGSLLLFAALAAVMYLTRGVDWAARG